MKAIFMQLKRNMRPIKLCTLLLLCVTMMFSCISEGEETYVLEEPTLKATQMIIGGWKYSDVKVLDEEGNEVTNLGTDNIDQDIPNIEFDNEGNYTITHPNGETDKGVWSISDDESHLHIGDTDWEIYSFGENRLVLIYEYYYEGKYYYIMYIFDRTFSPADTPETDEGSMPGLGDISDNNPYKPTEKNLISKITLNRSSSTGDSKVIHTFQYDKKSRIIEYVVQSTNSKGSSETNTFNFIYDNSKVYLYMNGEMLNNGTIGANGYLSNLYKTNTSNINSTFTYNTKGQLTKLNVEGSSSNWSPSYDNEGNMTSPQPNGDQLKYNYDIFNKYSVDLNGLFTSCYQWEWFMHLDYSGVVFGLFDFYGQRGNRVAYSCQRGNYWIDGIKDFTGGWSANPNDTSDRLTYVVIERSGLNNSFVARYEIEYYE